MVQANSAAAVRFVAKARTTTAKPLSTESKDKGLESGDLAAGNWPHRGASHDGVDIGVIPHVEHASRSGPGGDGKNRGKGG
jgi:hypothetical protein